MNPSDSTANASRLGVMILGAGASSRMGRPKLLLPWNGSTIIAHLVGQWQGLGADQIAVVCRPNDEPLFAELDRLAISREHQIINPGPERGMFSSVLCAANWDGWRADLTSWAIVLGDQPQLRSETLATLLAFHREQSRAICQPSYDDRGGHPVLLARGAFARLQRTTAATLNIFLKQNADDMVKCPVDDPGLLLDLDTPEDYKRETRNQPANERR